MYLFFQENKVKLSKFIVIFAFLIFSPVIANAATLSITPASGSFEAGDRVTIKVIVNSSSTPFNAVSGVVAFPPSIFSVDSVSKANSVLNFWVTEPVISANTVKFEGIALGGSTSSTGTIITVNLHAIRSGEGQVSFKSAQILANDGDGTDITGNLTGGSFTVKDAPVKTTPVKVAPAPEPEPTLEPAPVEVKQPAPSLKAPEIMLGTKYGALSISGTSDYPKTPVLLTFVASDGAKLFIQGDSDEDGSFNILVPSSLKYGSYSVTAVMIKPDKTNSDTSNVILVTIGNVISDITWQIWLVIALLVIAILYLFIRLHAHFGKKNNNMGVDKHKIHEAEDVVHKSFDILREDVQEFDNNEKLTVKDHKQISDIEKDISEAEKVIDKKVKDIE